MRPNTRMLLTAPQFKGALSSVKAWMVNLCVVALACASHARSASSPDRDLVRSFATLADSVSFADARYGWSECCWQSLLVLRPRGTWTLVHVDTAVHWFEAPADSAIFRRVTARLVQLGFAAGWPSSFGATRLDVPVATLTLRAPGQCHQTSASPGDGAGELPGEWLAARAVLDSLAANVVWAARSPPAWAAADRYTIAPRSMCRPSEISLR
jgi:hypothetical protein